MKHQVYAGPFPVLETRFLEVIADLQTGDPLAPVSILVGSNVLASYLRGRIAGKGRAAANIRFYTFLDLVAKLGGHVSGAGGRVRLSSLAPAAILEDLLEQNTPGAFRQVAEFAGFRSSLLQTFRDLRDAGVSPEILQESIGELIRHEPDRAHHLRGLAEIFGRYRERIAPFPDVDDDFRRAIAEAPGAGHALQTSHLLVYGIYDVTGQQGDLLYALRNVLDITYFVPYVDDSASGFAGRFLKSRAEDLDTGIVRLDPEPAHNGAATLASRVFVPPGSWSGPLAADSSFALVSVPGDSRAAVEIVREILRAVRDGVISGFHEAAVVLRHPEDDQPLLTEALRTRGIPYYIHGGSSFSQRPLGRAIAAVLGLESEGFSRQAILTAMELVAAALPAEGAALWEVAEWRALTNDFRFLGGIDAWDQGTRVLIEEAEEGLRQAEAGGAGDGDGEFEEKILPVALARRRLGSARSLRSGWEALRSSGAGWPAALGWSAWARLLEERLWPLLGASGDWEAFSTVLDDLGCLERLAGEGGPAPVSRNRLAAALGEALAALTYPEGRFQQRGVNLLSTAAARGLRFPLVIVPGLDEGKFPSRLRQDPLLLDHERRQIGSPPKLPERSLRGEEEKLLFDMAMRSAEKRLVLITSRLDEGSDRERIPSDFFLRAAAAAGGSTLGLRELAEDSVPGFRSVSLENPAPAERLVAVDAGEIRLRMITGNRLLAGTVLDAIAAAESQLLGGPLAFDRARWQQKLTGYDGRFQRPDLIAWLRQKLSPAEGQFSSGRIEEYARCPYLFYLKRAMDLAKWEEVAPAPALDPLERGRAVHKILEIFLAGLHGLDLTTAPVDELWASLEKGAQQELAAARPPGVPDLLWEIERDGLLRLLREWLAFEKGRAGQGLRPASFERTFGRMRPDLDLPAYRARAGKHTFTFRGRIDRVDVSEDRTRARVIDYKVGRLPPAMARSTRSLLMSGEKMQLAVYRGALSVLPDLSSVKSVEGEYLHLQPRDCDVVARAFNDDQLRAAVGRLLQILEVIGDLIDGGVFFARSSGSVYPTGHCDHCDYLMICGKDRVQREERKSGDPGVQRFASLRSIDGADADEP
jgi:hypothetical protein